VVSSNHVLYADRLPSPSIYHRERSKGPAVPASIFTPGVVAILLLFALPGFAQGTQPLQIPAQTLPRAIFHSDYSASVTATGGTPPHTWSIESGELPPGLNLDSTSGLISGRPRALGTYRFTVKVTDSARPSANTATARFSIAVVTAFALTWKSPPQVTADGIYGAVKLENQTPDDVDLTFIVVAVNEIGKAFALGYQHSSFASGAKEEEIKFGSSLPQGTYLVHVDAIGEVPAKYEIYRQHLQSSQPLQKP
jgi:hypothetical protein